MPFVKRNAQGTVVALLADAQPDAQEYLASGHAEVLAFLAQQDGEEGVQRALRESDGELARVTEDLVHLLVEKNLIRFTDLPEAVQNKLLSREQLRAQLLSSPSSPLSEDDTL